MNDFVDFFLPLSELPDDLFDAAFVSADLAIVLNFLSLRGVRVCEWPPARGLVSNLCTFTVYFELDLAFLHRHNGTLNLSITQPQYLIQSILVIRIISVSGNTILITTLTQSGIPVLRSGTWNFDQKQKHSYIENFSYIECCYIENRFYTEELSMYEGAARQDTMHPI